MTPLIPGDAQEAGPLREDAAAEGEAEPMGGVEPADDARVPLDQPPPGPELVGELQRHQGGTRQESVQKEIVLKTNVLMWPCLIWVVSSMSKYLHYHRVECQPFNIGCLWV